MKPARTYADTTYNSANPLQRYAHRTRFRRALNLINLGPEETLLDFGCGDGRFINELSRVSGKANSVFGYEPYMSPAADSHAENIYVDLSTLQSKHRHFHVHDRQWHNLNSIHIKNVRCEYVKI